MSISLMMIVHSGLPSCIPWWHRYQHAS